MKINLQSSLSIATLAIGLCGILTNASAQAVDVAAAEAQLKDSKCTKCHAVSSKKDGPSMKEIAAKYKGKADAEAKLIKHITTGPKVKVDGFEEEHAIIKTKDTVAIKNVVAYFLTR